MNGLRSIIEASVFQHRLTPFVIGGRTMPQEESLSRCMCGNPQCQIATGICHCGCGGRTTVYYGSIRSYIHGHNNCTSPFKPFTLEEGECICRDPSCKIPYGMCHCGCGTKVPLAKRNRRYGDHVLGKPTRYCNGHNNSLVTTQQIFLPDGMCICRNPECGVLFGECHCGCGKKTLISTRSDELKGWVLGSPKVYIHGHRFRLSPVDYVEEDRGYATPCWIWKLSTNLHGYGQTKKFRTSNIAHIVFYERKYGKVPDGLELDHLCRIRLCVNPDHLEPVTRMVNVQRGAQAKLSPKDVLQIRDLYKIMRCTDIAELYNVSPTAITDVAYRKSWKNI